MKEIKKSSLEERGYREKGKIDLVNNKKEATIVNIMGVVIVLVMLAFVPLFFKKGLFDFFRDNYFLKCFVFLLSLFLYIPLHEIVHGIFLKAFTHEKLSFGWKFVYAYCGSKEGVTRPKEYFIVALSPLVVFTLVFVSLMVLNPEFSILWYYMEVMNVSGSVGDIYVTVKLWKERKYDILINDTGTDMTIWGN